MSTGSAATRNRAAKQRAGIVHLARVLTDAIWSGKPAPWREEVLSKAMVKYARAFPDTTSPDNTAAWFRQVIRTTGYDLHRAEKAHPEEALDDSFPVLPGGVAVNSWLHQVIASGPGKKVARDVLLEEIFGLVSPDEAKLIRLKHLHNLSSQEIAEELGLSEDTVNTRVSRARRALRQALAARPDLVQELHAPMPQPF